MLNQHCRDLNYGWRLKNYASSHSHCSKPNGFSCVCPSSATVRWIFSFGWGSMGSLFQNQTKSELLFCFVQNTLFAMKRHLILGKFYIGAQHVTLHMSVLFLCIASLDGFIMCLEGSVVKGLAKKPQQNKTSVRWDPTLHQPCSALDSAIITTDM